MVLTSKICTKCNRDLPLESFYANRATKDGKTYWCKACITQRYEQNREEFIAKSRAWYHKNKERARATNRRYKKENRDHINTYNRERHKANPELRRAREKRYMEKNAEKVKRRRNKLYKVRPGPTRLAHAARRARRWRAAGACSLTQWLSKVEFHGWKCLYCKTPLTWETMHIEHRKPLARGGSHWPANLAPACQRCNLRKRVKTDTEFYKLRDAFFAERNVYTLSTRYSARGITRRSSI